MQTDCLAIHMYVYLSWINLLFEWTGDLLNSVTMATVFSHLLASFQMFKKQLCYIPQHIFQYS